MRTTDFTKEYRKGLKLYKGMDETRASNKGESNEGGDKKTGGFGGLVGISTKVKGGLPSDTVGIGNDIPSGGSNSIVLQYYCKVL